MNLIYVKNKKTNQIFQAFQIQNFQGFEIVFEKVFKIPPDLSYLYIGRPSIFGNPFSHLEYTLAKFKTQSREEAIKKYEEYFQSNSQIQQELLKIKYPICLECFCLPQKCHSEVIIKYLWNLK